MHRLNAYLSHRQIAAALNLSIGAVSKYLTAAKRAGIESYPLSSDLTDNELEEIIFSTEKRERPRQRQLIIPDFAYLHQELKQKGVTLQLLWEEYCEAADVTNENEL